MDLDKFQEPTAAIKPPYNSARESAFINRLWLENPAPQFFKLNLFR